MKTVEIMRELHHVFVFILSDFVARYLVARPADRVFTDELDGLAERVGLTMQERRIMILLLLGLSYDEVANTLNVSLNTVRFHLRSIYSKTETHSHSELFAKFFTPRIDPGNGSDKGQR